MYRYLTTLVIYLAVFTSCQVDSDIEPTVEAAETAAVRDRDIAALQTVVEQRLEAMNYDLLALRDVAGDTAGVDSITRSIASDAIGDIRQNRDVIDRELSLLSASADLYVDKKRIVRESLYKIESSIHQSNLEIASEAGRWDEKAQQLLSKLHSELQQIGDSIGDDEPQNYSELIERLQARRSELSETLASIQKDAEYGDEARRRFTRDIAEFAADLHRVVDSRRLVEKTGVPIE